MSKHASAPNKLPLHYRIMMSMLGLLEPVLHLSCRSFSRLSSEKNERGLGALEKFRYGLHRSICGVCREHEKKMDQLEVFVETLRDKPSTTIVEPLSEEALERIRKSLDNATEGETPKDSGS